jgi:hypothetical protein
MTTKLKPHLAVALGRTFAKQIPDLDLTPGVKTVDTEVNLRVVGTIDVKEDTEAAPKFNSQLEKVLAVVIGNIEQHFPDISEDLRSDIERALKTCATRPQTVEKNYSKEILVVEDMLKVAQAAHEKKNDKKVRKGARTFHGTVEVIK